MINGVNSVPLYPIFFNNQVPVPDKAPFEDTEEKESLADITDNFGPKEPKEVTTSLIDSNENKQKELEKIKKETPREVVEEKEKKEKKDPIPSLMEIIESRLEEEKEEKPMAYSVKTIRKAMEIPQQSVEILLRKLGLYKKIDLLI
ncbi:MAG: hypothetical protein QMD92_01195 [bacterium]|nr:hypothetical protein [bacterium]